MFGGKRHTTKLQLTCMKEIIIISGFSGVGKGTVLEGIENEFEIVRSYTTRKPRKENEYYTFVDTDTFLAKQKEGFFLESNEYGTGALYGTPRHEVKRILAEGKTPILEIDCNGLQRVLSGKEYSVRSLFVACDAASLFHRLTERKTETKEEIRIRLQTALNEAANIPLYTAVLINDDSLRAQIALSSFLHGQNDYALFDVPQFIKELQAILAAY